MKEIPKINYVLLGVMSIITILVVVYMSNWYKASKSYQLESSIMTNFLGEIKESEIENYILENPEIVIYISNDQEDETKKFEKKLKNFIIKEEVKSHFIYLDCNNISSEFMKKFQKNYFKDSLKTLYLSYPNLLIVNDRKIVDILYKLDQEVDINDVKQFLEKNGVLDNA